MKYVHFTDAEGARLIKESKKLLASSLINGVYAVNLETGYYVPGVQETTLGRPTNRQTAVIFETDAVPAYEYEEESVWHADYIDIKNVIITSSKEAASMLKSVEDLS